MLGQRKAFKKLGCEFRLRVKLTHHHVSHVNDSEIFYLIYALQTSVWPSLDTMLSANCIHSKPCKIFSPGSGAMRQDHVTPADNEGYQQDLLH
jgi:hypothetical protein